MEKLFELSCQDQTLNPQVGTFTDASQTTGTFTLDDGEYYLTNGGTKGFYAYKPVAIQSGLVDDSKVIIEFDLKVVTASADTHTIIGTYAGVDGSGIPTGDKVTLQYTAGDIELVLGSGTTETLIAAADVVVDQWYHFRIDCALAPTESTYEVKIDGVLIATVTGATADYELGIISVLGTDLHACDECGIKNITFVTETNLYVGRTALDQALQDVKGYVDTHCMDLTSAQTVAGNKTFSNGLFASLDTQGDIATLTDLSINSSNEDANGMPLTEHTNSVKIKGSQFNVVPCMLTGQVFTSGDTSAELRAYKYKDLTTNATIAIRYVYASNSGFVQFKNISSLVPNITSTSNLGSPSLQWNSTYTRNILIDNDINIANSLINKTSTSGSLAIRCGTNYTDGASIGLYAKDYSGALSGCIYMVAYGNSDNTDFCISPNGVMTVYNNSTATTKNVAMQEDVVPRSGGAVVTGGSLGRTTEDSELRIDGGNGYLAGASLTLSGMYKPGIYAGALCLTASKYGSTKGMWLYPDGTWTWDGSAVQLVSDQRYKQQIAEIDDKLLDAWEDVNLVQFKYNDAVGQKGTKARLHTGYVVQQIDSACKEHNVDISEYGLYCHEEYPQETEEVEVEQEDGTKVKETKVIREASEHYSLRYTEVYAVECMYLRRCIKQLTARIEQLEKGKEQETSK